MDILFRLRVLLWVMVLGLWGTLIHQFLVDDLGSNGVPVIQWVKNPFPNAKPLLAKRYKGVREGVTRVPAKTAKLFDIEDAAAVGLTRADGVDKVRGGADVRAVAGQAEGGNQLRRHMAERFAEEATPEVTRKVRVPRGFTKHESKHFIIMQEGDTVSPDLVESLETLHGNLMLDLAAFSPWGNREKVFIYAFKHQKTYQRITGRPTWSGGASSVERRAVYVFESDEAQGILAHELTHIYFDSFFLGGKESPLWLSEGMATWIQVERGLAAPEWLAENLRVLENGGGFTLKDMVAVDDTSGASDEIVRLWYAQAYSVVRYMLRAQWVPNFVQFSTLLRSGVSVDGALVRSYQKPFTKLGALEQAWRADLRRRGRARRHREQVASAQRGGMATEALRSEFEIPVASKGFRGAPKARRAPARNTGKPRLGTSLSPGTGADFTPPAGAETAASQP